MAFKKTGTRNKFPKGVSGNPAGRTPIYEDYNVRALHILDKYEVQKIMGIVRIVRTQAKDRKTATDKSLYSEAMKLSGRDLTIMMSIATAFTTNGALPFANLLDRAVGKPVQHVKIDQTITDKSLVQKADDEADAMLNKLAQRMGTPPASKATH